MPCNDAHAEAVVSSTSISSACHDDAEPLSECCTPFCICSCCQGFVVVIGTTSYSCPQFYAGVSFTFYQPHVPNSGPYDFWQPPRIS